MTLDESAHFPHLLPDGPGLPGPQRVTQDHAQRNRIARMDDKQADAYDVEARFADAAANARDLAATERDVEAEAEMFIGQTTTSAYRGRRDRDAAARDRTAAVEDRARAQRDRKAGKHGRRRASGDRIAAMEGVAYLRDLLDEVEDDAEDMLVVGRAQGMLMQEHDYSAAEALLAVAMRAARKHTNLKHAALDVSNDSSD